jgi:uncharacterized membrane protein
MANTLSRIITGIIMVILGLVLFVAPFFGNFHGAWFVTWIYGIPLLIISFFILFNKTEDKIEERKDLKVKRIKK